MKRYAFLQSIVFGLLVFITGCTARSGFAPVTDSPTPLAPASPVPSQASQPTSTPIPPTVVIPTVTAPALPPDIAISNLNLELGAIAAPVSASTSQGQPQLAFADGNIYRINADGTELVRLTQLDGYAQSRPVWSPDGRMLAFFGSAVSADAGKLYLMDADGKELTALDVTTHWSSWESRVRGLRSYDDPAWSPDGAYLAVTSFRDDRHGVSIVNVAHHTTVAFLEHAFKASWSPDGQRFAFLLQSPQAVALHIIGVNTDYDLEIPLTALYGGVQSAMAWSPDGKYLAYSDRDRAGSRFRIFVASIDSGEMAPLMDESACSAGGPAWSPDGEWIAFNMRPFSQGTACATDIGSDIWLIHPDGTGLRQLTDGKLLDEFGGFWDPVWSPDGNRLAAILDQTAGSQIMYGKWNLVIIDVSSGDIVQITDMLAPESGMGGDWPAWRP